MTITIILIFLAQLAYSIISTLKLSVMAGVSVEAVVGNWLALGSAVVVGVVGNIAAHKIRQRKRHINRYIDDATEKSIVASGLD